MRKIAVTGGIGSGKSTVCKILSDVLDCESYSADHIVLQFYSDINFCSKFLKDNIFFKRVMNENGLVDKVMLKDYILNGEISLNDLSKIIWPHVEKEVLARINSSKSKNILFEIPLLFESSMDKFFDLVINVEADFDLRAKRNEQNPLFKKILENQISDQERREKSDITILNNSSLDKLRDDLIKMFC
jgi:dephospho-CoA kinase